MAVILAALMVMGCTWYSDHNPGCRLTGPSHCLVHIPGHFWIQFNSCLGQSCLAALQRSSAYQHLYFPKFSKIQPDFLGHFRRFQLPREDRIFLSLCVIYLELPLCQNVEYLSVFICYSNVHYNLLPWFVLLQLKASRHRVFGSSSRSSFLRPDTAGSCLPWDFQPFFH